MIGMDQDGPDATLQSLIREIDSSLKTGQTFDKARLESLRGNLAKIQEHFANLSSRDAGAIQSAVVASANGIEGKITAAGEGGVRYEVLSDRIPPNLKKSGQTIAIAPGLRQRTLLYEKEFLGSVGSVGRVARVLNDTSGLVRVQLNEGLVVEADEDLSRMGPRAGDLLRFDPSRLLAFELISRGDSERTGPVGQVTHLLPGPPPRFQIAYGSGEAFLVDPGEELLKQNVGVGDWISFDPVSRSAFGKVDDLQGAGDAVGSVGEVVDIFTTWHEGGGRTRRLHVNAGGGQGMLARMAPGLESEELTTGDLVRIDLKTMVVHERLKSYDVSDLRPEEIGDTPYDRIGGLTEAVMEVRKAMEWPYLHPEVYRTYELRGTKGILLYGPPGCGKTLIAKAIASNLRDRIAQELKRPEVQAHLERLIEGLRLHRALLRNEHEAQDVAQAWSTMRSRLPESARRRLPPDDQAGECSAKELHQQIKSYLLANDVANLDAPDAEIGKIQELRDHDPQGNVKEPHVRACFLSVAGPELLTKWVGETEHKIRKLFEKARRHAGPYCPAIIFLDEIESMFQQRGSGISSDVEKTIVPQFLAELDGVRELRNVIFIGASNRVELIDPALLRPGRLDRKIRIERPDVDAAVQILLKYLKPGLPVSEGPPTLARKLADVLYHERSYVQITNRRAERLIVPAHQFSSGAILESVVTRAKKSAAEVWIEKFGQELAPPDFGPPTGEVGLITALGLKEALKQEFEENKDHFAVSILATQEADSRRRPSIDDLTVTVHWAEEMTDRWTEPFPETL
jgi:SpoVK/Ycf46/Vps4 family AAA+-type ATPase